jgi:hypothetical protein
VRPLTPTPPGIRITDHGGSVDHLVRSDYVALPHTGEILTFLDLLDYDVKSQPYRSVGSQAFRLRGMCITKSKKPASYPRGCICDSPEVKAKRCGGFVPRPLFGTFSDCLQLFSSIFISPVRTQENSALSLFQVGSPIVSRARMFGACLHRS